MGASTSAALASTSLCVLLLLAPPVPAQEEEGELWAEIEALRQRQRLLHELGRYEDAQQAAESWRDAARSVGDEKEALAAIRSLARSLMAQGEDAATVELLSTAVPAASGLGEAALEAELLLYLARAQSEGAAYADAADALERAAQILRQIDEPELTVRLWLGRGVLSAYRRHPYEALAAYEEAIRLGLEIDSPLLPSAYTSLAQTQRSVHDYAAAVATLRKSQELGEEPNIVTLIELGICHFDLNQLDQAEEAFEAARTLAQEREILPLASWATGELGLVAWERGEPARAEELFDRALALAQQAGDRRNEIVWWMNKGRMRRDQGRYREALELYSRAEALQRDIAGLRPDPSLYKHMAQCEAGLARPERALPLLERAIAMAAEVNDRKTLWEANRELAHLHREGGRRHEAEAAFAAALEAVESVRSSLRLESFKADFFTDKIQLYEEYVAYLAAGPEPAYRARAFEVAERARARAFLDSLVESRARVETTLPQELRLQEEAILDRISALQAAQRRGRAADGAASELLRLENEIEALYLQVRREYPRYGGLTAVRVAPLETLQQALRPGELLLEYFVAEPASHLWLVGKDRFEHRTLQGQQELEGAVAELYARLVVPESDLAGAPSRVARMVLPELDTMPSIDSLLVVPSGTLFLIPFEVLPLDDGTPLGERLATSYLPSASILTELRQRPIVAPPPRLLALADPLDAREPEETRSGIERLESLGALPHARREVARVRSRFGPSASTVLLGNAATEGRLKTLPLRQYSVLHFATHGLLDARSPARSGIVLAREPQSTEDGLLQPREILRLQLAADLVTLSACQTALGNLVTGEGIVGLSRAFFYAGTDSVVASLWNVNDEATAEFMQLFYGFLAAGESKGQALRRARSAMRERRPHPFYWAPWILLGRGEDGVELPARLFSFRRLLLLLTTGLLLVGWWLVRRLRNGG